MIWLSRFATHVNQFVMDQRAVKKASDRLRMAGKALNELTAARGFHATSDAWVAYLIAWKGTYSMIDLGSRTSADDQAWFQDWKDKKNATPLLKYLYEARNDVEHGLGEIVSDEPEQRMLGIAAPGFSNAVRFSIINGVATTESLDGLPVLNKFRPRRTVLLPVTGNGRTIPVPEEFSDAPINQGDAPLRAAMEGYNFVAALVEAAEARVA